MNDTTVVYPGTVLKYTRTGSTACGNLYLVAVRCQGKDSGRSRERCTIPVLVNLATGLSGFGTVTPPLNEVDNWKDRGMPLVDIVGHKAKDFIITDIGEITPIKGR